MASGITLGLSSRILPLLTVLLQVEKSGGQTRSEAGGGRMKGREGQMREDAEERGKEGRGGDSKKGGRNRIQKS